MVEILRFKESEKGCPGILLIEDELFCLTLEPDANDPERTQIPEGYYVCKRFWGTKFGETFEVLVRGHSAVLFHWGNREEDTEMCVLLGMMKGYNSVGYSRIAHTAFMKRMKGIDEFVLRISRYGKNC